MDTNTPADAIRNSMGLDTNTPPFAATAAALMDPFTGQRGGRVPTFTLTANDAAFAAKPGVFILNKAGVLALTIPSPRANIDDGLVMTFIAATAQANTITVTAGFGGGTTARDVATFGGAINDGISMVAVQGVWYPMPTTRNVTIA